MQEVASKEPADRDKSCEASVDAQPYLELYQLSRTHFNGYRWIAGDLRRGVVAMELSSDEDVSEMLSMFQAGGWLVVEHRLTATVTHRRPANARIRDWMKGRDILVTAKSDLAADCVTIHGRGHGGSQAKLCCGSAPSALLLARRRPPTGKTAAIGSGCPARCGRGAVFQPRRVQERARQGEKESLVVVNEGIGGLQRSWISALRPGVGGVQRAVRGSNDTIGRV